MSIRSLASGAMLVLSVAAVGLSAESTLVPDLARIGDSQI